MAAGVLSQPGTEFGPCEASCEHRHCMATRRIAESACAICGDPIGYGRRFYDDDDGITHAVCTEEWIEREQGGSA